MAAALTALIGVDRELRAKPAGLRTNVVVGIATAGFALAGATGFDGGDPTRVASQIVSGIGFLGGGAIFAAGGKPHGLTTAAALWGSAAVGLASGIGRFDIALAIVAVTVLALWPLDLVGTRLLGPRTRLELRLYVVLHEVRDIAAVQTAIDQRRTRMKELELQQVDGEVVADLVVVGRPDEVRELVGALEELPGVVAVARQGFGRTAR